MSLFEDIIRFFFHNTEKIFYYFLRLLSYASGSRKLINVSHRAGYPKKVRKIKDTRRHKRRGKKHFIQTGMPLWLKKRKITKQPCQENSWWMKSAAKFATAGFTAVRTWAEKALYTRTTTIRRV